MKVVITGSLGHISKPLTTELVQKGHEVPVISSTISLFRNFNGLAVKQNFLL